MNESVITLGGGCFWCTEAVFQRVRGIGHVECGYANGHQPARPDYEAVCNGETGYAEVVRVQFDPDIIDLPTVLKIFFATHDPTSLNRQGADVGTQYRSGIYTHSAQQQAIATALVEELQASGVFPSPIVTEVQALRQYWPAEDYHQNYFAQHPHQPYCAVVIAPKLEKLALHLPDWLK